MAEITTAFMILDTDDNVIGGPFETLSEARAAAPHGEPWAIIEQEFVCPAAALVETHDGVSFWPPSDPDDATRVLAPEL